MAVGTGRSYEVYFLGKKELLEDLNDARDALNALDDIKGVRGYSPAGTRMMRELRKQTRIMTNQIAIPAIKERGYAMGSRFDRAIADTAAAKNDRLPVVKVGASNPKVSGFRRTKVEQRKTARGQLAWGSENGPWVEGMKPGVGEKSGHYGHGRVEPGRWIYWAVNSASVTRRISGAYAEVVNAIFEKWRWGPRYGDAARTEWIGGAGRAA